MEFVGCYEEISSSQVRYFFMSKCKQLDLVLKGLLIKNPLETTYNTSLSSKLCLELSFKLRNHLINVFYSKQRNLVSSINYFKKELEKSAEYATTDSISKEIYDRKLSELFKSKLSKLRTLMNNSAPTNNYSQNPKSALSVVNLSKHALTKAEADVLAKGLSFCTVKEVDDIQLFGDIETSFRRLRLKEFFYDNSHGQSPH